jgi:DNA-binding MarR family transcriptional regulator
MSTDSNRSEGLRSESRISTHRVAESTQWQAQWPRLIGNSLTPVLSNLYRAAMSNPELPVLARPAPTLPRAAYTEAGASLFQLLRQLEISLPLLSPLPVSHGRMSILRALALHGPLHLSEIARLRAVSRQGVQRLAELLEREGLVQSRSHPRTARARLLELTEEGARAYRELARHEARGLNALAAGLSPAELRAATKVLRLLAERQRPA